MSELKKAAAPAAKKAAKAAKNVAATAKVAPAKKATKAPVEKKATKAPAEKKAPAAKKAAAPKNVKLNVIVEHHGRQIDATAIAKTAEKLWVKTGHEAAKMSKVELYVKQEDGAVYCVVNGEAVGQYDL